MALLLWGAQRKPLSMQSLFLIAAGLTLNAPNFSQEALGVSYFEWLSNSMLVAAIVVLVVLWWARSATKRMEIVPGGTQNSFEAVVEFLYDMLEGIVGKHMVARAFSLLATLFIFILFANWFGLLPGVGSIGWGENVPGHGFEVRVPLLRPTTADLNMTLGMAVVAFCLWLYWTISEVGVWGFLVHTFGPKGGLKGAMKLIFAIIFFFVGVIEVVSIMVRPVSLSLRLFGNVFAGETLLSSMITLGNTLGLPAVVTYVMSLIVPVPFYFLELLVGLLQALVFTLLCAVYIQLSTSHDEEEEH
ncbi:MAG TPA: F0F1 ATP synthase subunit A [Terrimicrobiaceae bacterium]|nr:F0F1 ATP synthase subunit A [Terrimicrobiaceae bacterium]